MKKLTLQQQNYLELLELLSDLNYKLGYLDSLNSLPNTFNYFYKEEIKPVGNRIGEIKSDIYSFYYKEGYDLDDYLYSLEFTYYSMGLTGVYDEVLTDSGVYGFFTKELLEMGGVI